MICIGIDVGLTGAAAFIDSRGTCVVEALPTVELPGSGLIKRRIDGRAFSNLVLKHCAVGEPVKAAIEAVSTMGGQNNAVQTQGSLLRSLGAIETVLEMLRVPIVMVPPATWKRFYGLRKGKDEKDAAFKTRSREMTLRLYETAPVKLARQHNHAEAILIAHWLLRTSA